ncbi:MAG: alpha/beta hydrolase [Actinomycetes bacterium]
MDARPDAERQLDPQAEAFLAAAVSPAGAPSVDAARAAHHDTAAALGGEPEPVDEVRVIDVGDGAGELRARLVRPRFADADRPLPLVVFFHGGGWVVGTPETYAPLQHALANAAGALVLSVDYRLAPEHRHPAAVADALAATHWALAHADELGADVSRVGVCGDSAGGHLAAIVARKLPDRLAFQLLVYPVTDAVGGHPSLRENAEGYYLTAEGMRWYWQQYLPDGTDPRDPDVSPLRATLGGPLPPAFVLTAGFDPLRDEGDLYADQLEASGTRVVRYPVPGQVHGFVRWLAVMDAAREAVRVAAAFLRDVGPAEHFRGAHFRAEHAQEGTRRAP